MWTVCMQMGIHLMLSGVVWSSWRFFFFTDKSCWGMQSELDHGGICVYSSLVCKYTFHTKGDSYQVVRCRFLKDHIFDKFRSSLKTLSGQWVWWLRSHRKCMYTFRAKEGSFGVVLSCIIKVAMFLLDRCSVFTYGELVESKILSSTLHVVMHVYFIRHAGLIWSCLMLVSPNVQILFTKSWSYGVWRDGWTNDFCGRIDAGIMWIVCMQRRILFKLSRAGFSKFRMSSKSFNRFMCEELFQ